MVQRDKFLLFKNQNISNCNIVTEQRLVLGARKRMVEAKAIHRREMQGQGG